VNFGSTVLRSYGSTVLRSDLFRVPHSLRFVQRVGVWAYQHRSQCPHFPVATRSRRRCWLLPLLSCLKLGLKWSAEGGWVPHVSPSHVGSLAVAVVSTVRRLYLFRVPHSLRFFAKGGRCDPHQPILTTPLAEPRQLHHSSHRAISVSHRQTCAGSKPPVSALYVNAILSTTAIKLPDLASASVSRFPPPPSPCSSPTNRSPRLGPPWCDFD
jgi:hypothetical protein